MAYLIRQDRKGKGQKYTLNDSSVTQIGRDARECQIPFKNDLRVSKIHARVWKDDTDYLLEDKISRNDTYLNGQKIRGKGPQPLENGDEVVICDYQFVFCTDNINLIKPEENSTIEASMSESGRHILVRQPAEKLTRLLDIMTALTETVVIKDMWPVLAERLLEVFGQADRVLIFTDEEEIDNHWPEVVRIRRNQDRPTLFCRTIVRDCLHNGQAFLCKDVRSSNKFEVTSESFYESNIRSILCAPILGTSEQAIGVIQLDTHDPMRIFQEEDLTFLVAVAGQAGVVVQNLTRARLESDLQTAREIQEGFLPSSLPTIPGYEFTSLYQSAQDVGGDYYDFIELPDGRWAILLGDASGKGIPAALLMARFTSVAQNVFLTATSLASAFTMLNQQAGEMMSSDTFITLVGFLLDPRNNTIKYVNAGHPPPVMYRAQSGDFSEVFSTDFSSFPLGMVEGAEYREYELSLHPGDTLMLFSDGVLDARSGDDKTLGFSGIYRSLTKESRKADEMLNALIHGIQNHSRNGPQADDLTVVCFGRSATANGQE